MRDAEPSSVSVIEEEEEVKRTWGLVVSISETVKVITVSALSNEPSLALIVKLSDATPLVNWLVAELLKYVKFPPPLSSNVPWEGSASTVNVRLFPSASVAGISKVTSSNWSTVKVSAEITGASLTAATVTVTVPAELVKVPSEEVKVNVSEVVSLPSWVYVTTPFPSTVAVPFYGAEAIA